MLPMPGMQRPPSDIAAESNREMTRFDSLALAREAIRNSPRIIDIHKVVSDFKTKDRDWEEMYRNPRKLDLLEPATDKKLADKIDGIVRSATGKPIDAFVLRNRRPRR